MFTWPTRLIHILYIQPYESAYSTLKGGKVDPLTSEILDYIIRFLQLLINWPVAVIILIAIFMNLFQEPLAHWIERMGFRYKDFEAFPGQSPPSDVDEQNVPSVDENGEPASTELTEREELAVDKVAPSEEPDDGTPETVPIDFHETQLRMKDDLVLYWFFRYLEVFLVVDTKRVLMWLIREGPKTYSEYESSWMLDIPIPSSRKTIAEALQSNNLITIYNAIVTVTETGERFAKWANLASLSGPRRFPPPPSNWQFPKR
jgi:hypothetical protein